MRDFSRSKHEVFTHRKYYISKNPIYKEHLGRLFMDESVLIIRTTISTLATLKMNVNKTLKTKGRNVVKGHTRAMIQLNI